jgi:enoyl-CoA hydratase
MTEPEVLIRRQDGLGRITLNRPKALNSLTLGMVRTMTDALLRWRDDDQIQAVVIDGAGERGLCAGGDIRALYTAIREGDLSLPRTFWAEEYRLNSLLAQYRKPLIAIMDGICMGGGIGISAHGSHRVVTERSKVCMPEVGIGFAPDVGGTYLLSHAPGELGTHLTLTGETIEAGDAIHCGLADYYVPSERLPELIEEAATGIERFAEEPPPAELASHRNWIDEVYSASTVEEILRRLGERQEQKAEFAAKVIGTKSPTSLKVALRELRQARDMTLEQALDMEFRVSMACAHSSEFIEGVRATVVDKDRDPKWSPSALADVDEQRVRSFFEPPREGDLGLASG